MFEQSFRPNLRKVKRETFFLFHNTALLAVIDPAYSIRAFINASRCFLRHCFHKIVWSLGFKGLGFENKSNQKQQRLFKKTFKKINKIRFLKLISSRKDCAEVRRLLESLQGVSGTNRCEGSFMGD